MLWVVVAAATLMGFVDDQQIVRRLPAPFANDADASALGSCLANGSPIDLRRVLFAENRSLDINDRNGVIRLRLDRELLKIERPEDPGRGTLTIPIAYEIDRGSDLDIRIQFAILDGKLMLYWRETFLHQTYRQGLFEISGENIIRFCEGRGGIWISP